MSCTAYMSSLGPMGRAPDCSWMLGLRAVTHQAPIRQSSIYSEARRNPRRCCRSCGSECWHSCMARLSPCMPRSASHSAPDPAASKAFAKHICGISFHDHGPCQCNVCWGPLMWKPRGQRAMVARSQRPNALLPRILIGHDESFEMLPNILQDYHFPT